MTICICGAGTMGSGIAQVTAMSGYPTILYEMNPAVLEKASLLIDKNLDFLVSKAKITEDHKLATRANLRLVSDESQCVADIVIEAIIEDESAKLTLFNRMAEVNSQTTILVSNTSSLSIDALARGVKDPSRFAGLHFFNPAPLMKLVEIVKGRQTSDEVMGKLSAFVKSLGKEGVVCKDSPGFIVNRVARPFYIESLRLAEEGVANYATIDTILQSRGFKMGPFRLMDLIGNDINYAVSSSVYEQLGKPDRLKPSYLQKEKVDTGELGKKTGKGYYDPA